MSAPLEPLVGDATAIGVKSRTTWVSGEEVLAAKVPSPEYAAVIECEPAPSVEIDNCATPSTSELVPSEIAPSLNETDPEGVFDDVEIGDTAASNATVSPAAEGL
jgi:hypothetical protein